MTATGEVSFTEPHARRPVSEVLAAGPPVRHVRGAFEQIRRANREAGVWVVVLDDDPTGSQLVYGVPVVCRWEPEDLAWAFDQVGRTFFVMTNTRSVDRHRASAITEEVAAAVAAEATKRQVPFVLISRGDSTLRGHFPLETDVLADVARTAGRPYDLVLLAPAYPEAGRVTEGDVHYVRQDDEFVPVGDTDYASDASFGFRGSNLRDYVEEKADGLVRAGDVTSITLDDIRSGGPDRVRDVLESAREGTVVIANATDPRDLEIVGMGAIGAEQRGRRIVYRTGPSFVAIRAGIAPRAPLTHAEIYATGERTGNGLVVVGSHVNRTTQQVQCLVDSHRTEVIVVDVPLLLGDHAEQHLTEVAARLADSLGQTDTVLMTSRQWVTGDSASSSLDIARRVSAALVRLTRQVVQTVPVRWMIAKGGITSCDIATQALGIYRARVAGQLFPGIVSVWLHEGVERADLAGLPYVVFAGNVGDDRTLADAVSILRNDGAGHDTKGIPG